MKADVSRLGQVFTPPSVVKKMLRLRKNKSTILEPSAGTGAFLSYLGKQAVGIELDKRIIRDNRIINCDFFQYSLKNKFDTVIGNPPYVRYRDIDDRTKKLLPMEMFDRRSNLYLFFIAKCMEHLKPKGELIFITPRDFLKSTNARKLNQKLYENGTITHYYELGDSAVFDGYSPNCSIWRWQKGKTSRRMSTGGKFQCKNGQLWFSEDAPKNCLGDFFTIKVGAVSGADKIFANDKRGCTEFVCSTTAMDGKTRRMIYNRKDSSLMAYKKILINRKIKKFDESNWWEWGRKFCDREGRRIYVNCKTRSRNPFFVSGQTAYDGSVLALFPQEKMDLEKVAHQLNKVDWNKLGFVCDGRFLFTQRSLENAPIGL